MTSNHPISNLLIRKITPLQCVPLYWKRLCPIIIPMAQMCLHVHSMPQKLLTVWTVYSYSIFSWKGICQVWLYDCCLIHTADILCIRDGTLLCPNPYPWKMGSSRGCTVPDTFLYIFWWITEKYWAHRDWLPYWSSLLRRVGLCGRCGIIKPYRIWTVVIDLYMWKIRYWAQRYI